jgi:hypothetical protein
MEDDQAKRDERVIERFTKSVNAMFDERRLIRGGLDLNVTINWHHETGFSFSGSTHDWEDVLAFLGSLRRYLLPRDDLYVEKIAPIIRRHLTENDKVGDLDGQMASWRSNEWALPFTLEYTRPDGSHASVTALDLFDMYLSGEALHLDLAKAEELERVRANMPAEMVQFMIVDTAVENLKFVGILLNMIEYTRSHNGWSEALIDRPEANA